MLADYHTKLSEHFNEDLSLPVLEGPFGGDRSFASTAVLKACSNYSRSDDIISIFFVLLYLLNGYKLPWLTEDR